MLNINYVIYYITHKPLNPKVYFKNFNNVIWLLS